MVQHDVVVVGGGFSGLGVAAALAGTGARVTVLESARTVNPAFRGELIHPRGVRALRQLGLSKPLFEAGGVPVEGFAVTPGAEQDAMVLPYRAGAGTGLGIDHATMVMTLRREVAARPGVTIHTSTRAVDLERAGERVTGVRTADGRSFRADLVVLADGRQSKLRVALGLDPEIKLLSHHHRVRCDEAAALGAREAMSSWAGLGRFSRTPTARVRCASASTSP